MICTIFQPRAALAVETARFSPPNCPDDRRLKRRSLRSVDVLS